MKLVRLVFIILLLFYSIRDAEIYDANNKDAY